MRALVVVALCLGCSSQPRACYGGAQVTRTTHAGKEFRKQDSYETGVYVECTM